MKRLLFLPLILYDNYPWSSLKRENWLCFIFRKTSSDLLNILSARIGMSSSCPFHVFTFLRTFLLIVSTSSSLSSSSPHLPLSLLTLSPSSLHFMRSFEYHVCKNSQLSLSYNSSSPIHSFSTPYKPQHFPTWPPSWYQPSHNSGPTSTPTKPH